jgi:hypothetical protein
MEMAHNICFGMIHRSYISLSIGMPSIEATTLMDFLEIRCTFIINRVLDFFCF